MTDYNAVLNSEYIINGIQQELSPAQMLASVQLSPETNGALPEKSGSVIDETVDPSFKALEFDNTRIKEYLKNVSAANPKARSFQPAFAASLTRAQIASSLIDTIWCKGAFRLGDLALKASWKWDFEPIGNLAAFYASVEATADYADALGLRLADYKIEAAKMSRVDFTTSLGSAEMDSEDLLDQFPYHSNSPELSSGRMISDTLNSDKDSWIIYIPFETCEPRLGGSLIADTLGASGGIPMDINDADYFIDCYEVVREFVEDSIAISGETIGPGGLIAALKRMTGLRTGARIDISALLSAFKEKDAVRMLFSELPGVIIQIRDIDYDYIEAELLLQDVVFFPLGHPESGTSEIEITASEKSGIQNILESLINSQSSEGED